VVSTQQNKWNWLLQAGKLRETTSAVHGFPDCPIIRNSTEEHRHSSRLNHVSTSDAPSRIGMWLANPCRHIKSHQQSWTSNTHMFTLSYDGAQQSRRCHPSSQSSIARSRIRNLHVDLPEDHQQQTQLGTIKAPCMDGRVFLIPHCRRIPSGDE
jgi:hypothetical protein